MLDTDASNVGIGAVLCQVQCGMGRGTAFYSQAPSKPERNYYTTRRERLAIVKAIDHFHPHHNGRHFRIKTDQLYSCFSTSRTRRIEWHKLQTYDFCPGSSEELGSADLWVLPFSSALNFFVEMPK